MISKKALLVELRLSAFRARRQDRDLTIDLAKSKNTDDTMLSVSKRLLPESALQPITSHDSKIREYFNKRTLPWNDHGQRLMPTASFDEIMRELRGMRTERDILVRRFVADYPGYVAEARKRLNGEFNPGQYPSAHHIHTYFDYKLEVFPVPDTADFRVAVAAEDRAELEKDLRERLEFAARMAKNDLLSRLLPPLALMVERLGAEEPRFRDSLVGNVKELARLIPDLNITESPEIERLRVRIVDELLSYSADTLRDSPALRADTARRAQDIMNQMNAFMAAA